MEGTVTITKKQYEGLLDDSDFLEALRQAGVDNWDGWDHAVEIQKEWLEEDAENG
jgi:hypothetical protein